MGEWGRIRLGSVTGNNDYFALSDDQMAELGLSKQDVIPISPSGSRHLRSLSFSKRDFEALRNKKRKVWLFFPGEEPSQRAMSYIEQGVASGVPGGYKCRNRSPWWKVPLSEKADVFVTYMNDYSPQLCANYAGVRHLNSVHGMVLPDGARSIGMELLPLASINSATLLSCEIEGRAYGGGVIKVEPREATRLLVPSFDLVDECKQQLRSIRDEAQSLLETGDLLTVRDLVDDILLEALPSYSADARNAMREDKERLYKRRRFRGKKR